MIKILKIINFIFFRSPVYILSFISYNSKLFNIRKLISAFTSNNIIFYLEKYYTELNTFIILIILILLGFLFLENKIKGSREEPIKLKKIEKENPSDLVMYIGSYLLPMLASFNNLSFLWIIIYESFIYVIYCRHINFHYKVVMGFLYNGYTVTFENGKCFSLFSNKSVIEIESLIDEESSIKFIRFGDNFHENEILFF